MRNPGLQKQASPRILLGRYWHPHLDWVWVEPAGWALDMFSRDWLRSVTPWPPIEFQYQHETSIFASSWTLASVDRRVTLGHGSAYARLGTWFWKKCNYDHCSPYSWWSYEGFHLIKVVRRATKTHFLASCDPKSSVFVPIRTPFDKSSHHSHVQKFVRCSFFESKLAFKH